MKYNTYAEIPDSEKQFMKGSDIKYYAHDGNEEIIVINGNSADRKLFYPYDELEDEKVYTVYEDEWTAGSGISYGKMFIFESSDLENLLKEKMEVLEKAQREYDEMKKLCDSKTEIVKKYTNKCIKKTYDTFTEYMYVRYATIRNAYSVTLHGIAFTIDESGMNFHWHGEIVWNENDVKYYGKDKIEIITDEEYDKKLNYATTILERMNSREYPFDKMIQ